MRSASSTAASRSTTTGRASSPTPTSCCWRRRSRSIRRSFDAMAPHLGTHTIVTDAGSTKQDVIAAARAALGARCRDSSRPSDRGHRAHRARPPRLPTLFRDRNVVLTPLPETDPRAVATRRARCGKRAARDVRTLDADRARSRSSRRYPSAASARVRAGRRARARARTPPSCSASPPAAFAISRGSRRARPKCGATSRSPTAMRCSPKSTPIAAQLDAWRRMLAAGDGAALEAVFARARPRARDWDARRQRHRRPTSRQDESARPLDRAVAPLPRPARRCARRRARSRCPARRASPIARCCWRRSRAATTRSRGLLDADDVDRDARRALRRSACACDRDDGRRATSSCTARAARFRSTHARSVPRQCGHGVPPADRGARVRAAATTSSPACRACTSGRSATWSTRCARSAPTFATRGTTAFRRSRSVPGTPPTAAPDACACAATCRASS